jgi:hypothetical protein
MDQATLLRVANFDTATANQLAGDTGSLVDAVSAAGALDLGKYVTELTVSGTKAYTLAAPTFAGQRKRIVCVSAASSPLGTVTISAPDTTTGFACASAFTFDTVGQAIELQATVGLLWRATRVQRAGGAVNNVVVGTTVLTGFNLWLRYCLSVTATVASTGTQGIPNGSVVGERIIITNSTAASTPVGSITGAFTGMIAEAYTTIGAIGVVASTTVVGDCALCEWTGSSWSITYQNGCTLS